MIQNPKTEAGLLLNETLAAKNECEAAWLAMVAAKSQLIELLRGGGDSSEVRRFVSVGSRRKRQDSPRVAELRQAIAAEQEAHLTVNAEAVKLAEVALQEAEEAYYFAATTADLEQLRGELITASLTEPDEQKTAYLILKHQQIANLARENGSDE